MQNELSGTVAHCSCSTAASSVCHSRFRCLILHHTSSSSTLIWRIPLSRRASLAGVTLLIANSPEHLPFSTLKASSSARFLQKVVLVPRIMPLSLWVTCPDNPGLDSIDKTQVRV